MALNPEPFDMIKKGLKSIELRLYDEKRKKIRIGDSIIFTNNQSGETLTTFVKELHIFGSFGESYTARCLF